MTVVPLFAPAVCISPALACLLAALCGFLCCLFPLPPTADGEFFSLSFTLFAPWEYLCFLFVRPESFSVRFLACQLCLSIGILPPRHKGHLFRGFCWCRFFSWRHFRLPNCFLFLMSQKDCYECPVNAGSCEYQAKQAFFQHTCINEHLSNNMTPDSPLNEDNRFLLFACNKNYSRSICSDLNQSSNAFVQYLSMCLTTGNPPFPVTLASRKLQKMITRIFWWISNYFVENLSSTEFPKLLALK